MSRIGNNPVTIPEGVTVEVNENIITVKGKLGELQQEFSNVTVVVEDGSVVVTRPSDSKENKSKHGLYRALVNNMVAGVSKGWSKDLELVGVGYRASNQGQKLELALGFSHNIVLNVAPEVKIETVSEKGKNPIVKLTSHDKQLVGQVAAKIRSFRAPEPYKGKGIKENRLKKVFDPLYTDKTDGVGLGLSLCRDLISRHGGTISAKRKAIKGTIIEIELPLV